jgi:uncharacterized phage-associated protein
MNPFRFQKSIQLLNYFSVLEGGSLNKLKALKLMWASERLSLRTYGVTIIDDDFYAMKLGPVPSFTKDMAEGSESLSEEEAEFRNQYIKTTSKNAFRSLNSFDDSYFSESALKSMEAAYNTFGKFDGFELANITHLYPEWSKFSHFFPQYSRFDMDYQDFFNNPNTEYFDIFKQDPEQLIFMKQYFADENILTKAMYSI